ncbi:hypothetical protein FP744_10005044 [Trichoderma asperellum]
MNTINRPIFKEIAKIQRGIGLPPSADESDYGSCQAYTVNSNPCKRILRKKQDEIVNLLSEFRHITEYSEIDNLYDKMARFIELTHCHSHKDRALEAFSKWKTEWIATASSSSSTLATNAFFSSDSLDVSSESSSVASPTLSSPASGGSGRNPSASDLYVDETTRHLPPHRNLRNIATRRRDDNFDNTQELRDRMRSLGSVVFPSEDAQQNTLEIYSTIKYPPHPLRMYNGIIYIYEHASIPGIFKIGFSTKSAQQRHRQHGNCYGIDTNIIYETENPFAGAFQAERIIHAVLRHKQIQIYVCSNCGRGHREWFVTSREEAFKIVHSAESWLKMPAYTLHQGRYELSPRAEVIYGSMFSFSSTELGQHINNHDALDDTSDVFSVNHLVAATREISISTSSSPVARNGRSTESAGRTSTSALPILLDEQISPLSRAASALDMMNADEIRELTQRRSLPSTNLNSDEEYSDAEGSQDSDSDEYYSESDESEELDIDEEYTEGEESQEVDTDEEHSETEEPQESHTNEESHQGEAFGVRTRSEPNDATPEVNIELVRLLRAIRQGGAREFRIIFPS